MGPWLAEAAAHRCTGKPGAGSPGAGTLGRAAWQATEAAVLLPDSARQGPGEPCARGPPRHVMLLFVSLV